MGEHVNAEWVSWRRTPRAGWGRPQLLLLCSHLFSSVGLDKDPETKSPWWFLRVQSGRSGRNPLTFQNLLLPRSLSSVPSLPASPHPKPSIVHTVSVDPDAVEALSFLHSCDLRLVYKQDARVSAHATTSFVTTAVALTSRWLATEWSSVLTGLMKLSVKIVSHLHHILGVEGMSVFWQ